MTKSTKTDQDEHNPARVDVDKNIYPTLAAVIDAVPKKSRAETFRHHGEMGALLARFINSLQDINGLTTAIEALSKQLLKTAMANEAPLEPLTDTSPTDNEAEVTEQTINDKIAGIRDNLTSAAVAPDESNIVTPILLPESEQYSENSTVTVAADVTHIAEKSDQTVDNKSYIPKNLPANKAPQVALENQTLINENSDQKSKDSNNEVTSTTNQTDSAPQEPAVTSDNTDSQPIVESNLQSPEASDEPPQEHMEPEQAPQLSQPSLEPNDQATLVEDTSASLEATPETVEQRQHHDDIHERPASNTVHTQQTVLNEEPTQHQSPVPQSIENDGPDTDHNPRAEPPHRHYES